MLSDPQNRPAKIHATREGGIPGELPPTRPPRLAALCFASQRGVEAGGSWWAVVPPEDLLFGGGLFSVAGLSGSERWEAAQVRSGSSKHPDMRLVVCPKRALRRAALARHPLQCPFLRAEPI